MAILDDMRETINESGESRYSISLATGISQSQLSQFMKRNRGLSVEALELLADHLGLELVLKQKSRKKRKA